MAYYLQEIRKIEIRQHEISYYGWPELSMLMPALLALSLSVFVSTVCCNEMSCCNNQIPLTRVVVLLEGNYHYKYSVSGSPGIFSWLSANYIEADIWI